MKKAIQFCFTILFVSIFHFSNAQVVGTMTWVELGSETNGTCTSNTDCSNGIICYGLSYQPGETGTLSDYTTGFIVDCLGTENPIISNSSCIMTNNSGYIYGCPTGILINSSGNAGTTLVNKDTAYIIHQVCFSVPPSGDIIMITEDISSNLTTSIDLPNGTSVTDQPAYSTFQIIGNDICSSSSCTDGIMNGDETGIDCGGADCPACLLPGIYVDESATGNNDGSDWTNAFTDLQSALAIGADMNIHIAEGTYLPTSTTSRGQFFNIPSEATLLGGYPAGGGTRDPSLHSTILSGEIDGIAGPEGNSYHVVRLQNVTNVTIDGIEIADGSADNATSFGQSRGGGIYSKNSTSTFINTIIRNNNAVLGGGVFATLSDNIVFEGCTMSQNVAANGAAIYHSNETNLYLNNSYITDNNSTIRCAIEINNSLYTEINNSIIANNISKNANAIGFIATNRDQSCNIYNSTILGQANKDRSLLSLQIGFGDQLDVNIYNSIIAHLNPSFNKTAVIFNNNILNLNTTNCYVQGNTIAGNSMNNIYEDVVGAITYGTDYEPDNCSPTIDAGNNGNTNSLTTDFNGNNRFFNTVDIGAHEAQTSCPSSRKNISSDINIFPNPTSGIISIKTELETIDVSIFDALGQLVLSTNRKEIDLGHLSAGIYIVHVKGEDTLVQTTKIVKK